MAQKLNPFSGRQFLDANGDPYVGAQLFTYVAGSSTKTTTTKDSAGVSAHANPIILNSRGEPGDGAGASQAIWQSEGVSVKFVLAPATDTDPPVAAISTWDNLDGINDITLGAQDQWIAGPAPTYVSTTSFTLVGDQTTEFHVGRRLKTSNTGGTVYSIITDSAYTSLTTITVRNDSGTLDSGLSAVSYGLLTSVDNSIPAGQRHGTISWQKGTDIASATALVLGNDGNYFDVTGTTAITSIGTVAVGTTIKLHFDGALTLTHNATDLVLPGGKDITTAAGDEAEFFEYASADWRCTNYTKASGSYLGTVNGAIIQTVSVYDGEVATGATIIPIDDTIPQNTEGVEFITLAITPTSATSKLVIEGLVNVAHTTTTNVMAAALFQDSTGNALTASIGARDGAANIECQIYLKYEMAAGTVSETTFKIRAGTSVAGTTTFNGSNGLRRFGGVHNSFLRITEHAA